MSGWDDYIKTILKDELITDAAICGRLEGAESVWASSPGLSTITSAEIKRLAGDTSSFYIDGPSVAGRKCMLLRDGSEDPNTLCIDLKTKAGEDKLSYSVCVGKTKTAFVIAVGAQDVRGGHLITKLYPIVHHLRKENC